MCKAIISIHFARRLKELCGRIVSDDLGLSLPLSGCDFNSFRCFRQSSRAQSRIAGRRLLDCARFHRRFSFRRIPPAGPRNPPGARNDHTSVPCELRSPQALFIPRKAPMNRAQSRISGRHLWTAPFGLRPISSALFVQADSTCRFSESARRPKWAHFRPLRTPFAPGIFPPTQSGDESGAVQNFWPPSLDCARFHRRFLFRRIPPAGPRNPPSARNEHTSVPCELRSPQAFFPPRKAPMNRAQSKIAGRQLWTAPRGKRILTGGSAVRPLLCLQPLSLEPRPRLSCAAQLRPQLEAYRRAWQYSSASRA